jgi:enoyl-CoA hydratase/carnithine racemase
MPRAPGQTTDGAGPIFLERDATGIVTLSIVSGSSSQNVIDARFLGRLREILDELDAGPPPRGVILRSGRAGSFFAGADIDRVEAVLGAESAAIEQACATGRQLYARLSIRPWPTVALIDGVCLGGGLEIALACDFRVATSAEGTALGFPEVKLGLLPGWGGTVRLPRLIGPGPAVEMIAAGETMTGAAAALSGLVDACVPESQADATARFLIERGATTGSHLERRHRFSGVVDIAAEEREFLEATTGAVIQGRTSGHYPRWPGISCASSGSERGTVATAAWLSSGTRTSGAPTPRRAGPKRVRSSGRRWSVRASWGPGSRRPICASVRP